MVINHVALEALVAVLIALGYLDWCNYPCSRTMTASWWFVLDNGSPKTPDSDNVTRQQQGSAQSGLLARRRVGDRD
ncbi:hypothetical protein V8E55_006373 [Tylopilus felleus]